MKILRKPQLSLVTGQVGAGIGVSSELQFQGELARAGTTNSIERIEASVILVLRLTDLTKARTGNEIIKVCWRGRKHRVIEQVEILDAEK